jgi:hypothetical protein
LFIRVGAPARASKKGKFSERAKNGLDKPASIGRRLTKPSLQAILDNQCYRKDVRRRRPGFIFSSFDRLKVLRVMVCASREMCELESPFGGVRPMLEPGAGSDRYLGDWPTIGEAPLPAFVGETDEAKDPFDDFEEDDFDDEFDDDFEEDWEDDLTEDDEFPDTFGGEEPDEEEIKEADPPFADDPDFDEA